MAASPEEQARAKVEGFGANSYVVEPMNQDRLCKAFKDVGFGWVIINPMLGMPRMASA